MYVFLTCAAVVATTTPVVARGVFLDARRSKWRHVPATVALLLLAAGTVALFTPGRSP